MLLYVLAVVFVITSGTDSASLEVGNSTDYKHGHSFHCSSQISTLNAELIWQTSQFPHNTNNGGEVPCKWRIHSSSGVALYIDQIQNVQVHVFDGPDDGALAMGPVNKDNEGSMYYSSGTDMYVSINSDDYDNHGNDNNKQFDFSYIDKQGVEETCSSWSEHFHAQQEWTDLSTPGYVNALHGHGGHHDTYSCSWTFHSSGKVAINILDFNLDTDSGDFLTIFDGSSTSSKSKIVSLNGLEEDTIYQSTGEDLLIQLSSSNKDSTKGIYIQYSSAEDLYPTTHSPTTTPVDPTISTTTTDGPVSTTTEAPVKTTTAGYQDTTLLQTSTTPGHDGSSSNSLPPGIMTLLWILLFFAIILVCPVMYKLITRCCKVDTPSTTTGTHRDAWCTSDPSGQVNNAFASTKVSDLPPAYDTLSIKEAEKKEKEEKEEPAPPAYEQTSADNV